MVLLLCLVVLLLPLSANACISLPSTLQDSWDSVTGIIGWWAKMQDQLVPAAGPGAWNDPDQLIIGDFGLSPTQAKTQFSLWAMWAAPMLMSNDLRKLGDEYKSILQNSEVGVGCVWCVPL